MAAPIIQWQNATNTQQVTAWNLGTVDAGSTSADTVFLIWNNRGGSSDVSDVQSATITVKDIAGGDTGEIITDKWIKVKVDTMSEVSFTAVGGTTTKSLKAGGTAPAGTIKGTANDGTTANSTANYAQITAHAVPSVTATAGNVDFLLRLSYTFV